MHFTLQQLKLFEAVTRNSSYTRAAEEMFLTQPAVSIQIKRLEEQVKRLEKNVDFQKRENQILKDKIDLAKKSSEGILSEVREEKKMYKVNLESLKTQYSTLEDQVTEGLKRQKRKHDLVKQIITYDKENQILTEKINDLNVKIKALEAVVMEASISAEASF